MLELARYTKGYRLNSILSAIFVMGEVVMEVLIPSVMGDILNIVAPISAIGGVIPAEYISLIRNKSFTLILYALISLIFGVISAWCAANASTGFAKNLRMAVFKKLQLFSFKNIDRFSQGGLVTRLTGDIFYIQISYQMLIRVAIRLPFMLVFALVMSLKIHSGLARIYLFIIPILALILFLISLIVMPIYRKAFDKIDELNAATQENLHAIKVVKSFVKEEDEKKKFNRVINPLYKLLLKAEKTIALTNPIMRFVIYGCIITLSYFASKFIVLGDMQTGDLVALFTYNFQMFISMMFFAMVATMIIMSSTCFSRIKEVLDEKVDIKSPQDPVLHMENGDIRFKNVYFSYQGDVNKSVLRNINFDIKSGEMIGIIGPTGCAKTTLVNLIARLYDVTEGSVEVSGRDVREYELASLRDGVGIVLQKNNLFSGTLRSSLSWGKENATDSEIFDALKVAQIYDYVLSLPQGLDTRVEQGGKNFSGGQQQRLCIARSLLKNPKILILDDSSSALDTRTDKALRAALRNEKKSTTKIIIAQKILSVMECDKIIVMKNGEIEDIGGHDELLEKNEFYKTLFLSQLKKEDL